MEETHEHNSRQENKQAWWKTPFGLTAIFFFVVGGYFLIKEHGAHIGANWIWLILLACPLMHVFMHGGHGDHGGHGKNSESDGEEEK